MPTARDIVTLALQDAGVTGQGLTPSAIDINNGLTRLNDMIAQWQRLRWVIWHLVATDLPMTGATSYTVGEGGQFNIARPDHLEAARITQVTPGPPNDVGWPLLPVTSMEDYNRIRMQHLGSFPRYFFYDSAWPLAKVYFWPLPSFLYIGRIITKQQLQSFPNLSTDFDMPPEYRRAIRFSLQDEMITAYKLPADPVNSMRAAGALDVIRRANLQIPTLSLPPELARGGVYNVFTDNTI
jgi:hypothetical protein